MSANARDRRGSIVRSRASACPSRGVRRQAIEFKVALELGGTLRASRHAPHREAPHAARADAWEHRPTISKEACLRDGMG